MSTADTAREYYSNMRQEINVHIQLRDQALFLFLGAIGVLFGIAFSEPQTIEILLVVPFVGLGVAFIVSHHDAAIVTIASYCNHELDESLKANNEWLVPWDKSSSMCHFEEKLIINRFWAHFLMIILPVSFCIVVNYSHALWFPFPLSIAWWFGLISGLIAIYIIKDAAKYRRMLYSNYPKDEQP